MKTYSRADKVGGQIQKVLAELIARRIGDPRLKNTTLTGVEVSRDLRFAKIYFVTPGDAGARDKAMEGFAAAAGFMKRELAQALGLRYMPEIAFYYDSSIDRGSRIEELLKSLKTHDE